MRESAESVSMINPNITDVDQFKLMMEHKRSVVSISLYLGIPLVSAMAINNFIKGNHFVGFLNCAMFLIVIFYKFVIKGRTDEKFEYRIYSVLLRLFNAVVGITLLYEIGFQSNFSRIEWCYIYPILIFFVVGIREGIIWVSIFYAILAFFMLNFDLQEIPLSQIQELRTRFLVSFFAVCMLSIFLEHGFRNAHKRLLHHQSILKESENRYRQAYEQLNIEIQERKQAEEALQKSEEEAKRLAQENAVVAEIGRIISSTLNIEEVYGRFADEVRKLIPFDRITIHDIDLRNNTMHNAYVTGLNVAYRLKGGVFSLAGTSAEGAVRTRANMIIQIEDLKKVTDRFTELLSNFQAGIRSLMVIPLVSKDEVIGILHIQSTKPNAYSERDLSLAGKVGNQIAGAIANAQLFKERKRAEDSLKEKTEELARSNRDLEQFAYVTSHDLQEPLRMVTSYVQLLARRYKGKLDSDADDFINFAVDGATRMWKLINDLLTYSRVGTQARDLELTDSEMVLNQSLDNLKVAIEENGAVITHDPLPTVVADHLQLGQLFQNLIGNAIKFQGKEPPRIHISASRNGDGWTFSVRDNGIGIAPEYTERIFVIFQRLHGRETPGTGIGLAICKKIVERHGGRIWVESEVGKGATFYFTLLEGKVKQPSS